MAGTQGRRQRRKTFRQQVVRAQITQLGRVALKRYEDRQETYSRPPERALRLATPEHALERLTIERDQLWLIEQALHQDIYETVVVEKLLTWKQLAQAFGVTYQTVQKRYGKAPPGRRTTAPRKT